MHPTSAEPDLFSTPTVDDHAVAPAAPAREPAHWSADDILGALDPEQRMVASSPRGSMRVLAGAGTGKTRAITHRIAYGVVSGQLTGPHVMAVTFTARAAGEMRTRLRTLGARGVVARTFHAAALKQLHYFWPQAVGGPPPELLGHKARVVAEALNRLKISADKALLRDAASEIEWSKVSMATAETYPAVATSQHREAPGMDHRTMARLIAEYEQVKSTRGWIDFEDVLLLMVGILSERHDIRARVQEQYRHFVVDEYQDVNAVQHRLLSLWRGERSDICVVGDPSQTIYSFTGASARHLETFPHEVEGAQTVTLRRNYRSSPAIVEVANAVVHSAPRRTREAAVRLTAAGQRGPTPRVVAYSDDETEASSVIAEIQRRLEQGQRAAHVAVLCRTNGQLEQFERACGVHGVPYLVRGGERFFSREEVKKAIVLLRGAVRSDDAATPLGEVVRDVLTGAGWSPEPPAASGARREVWESLHALVTVADDLVHDVPEARLRELVEELRQRAAAQHAPEVEGVTLASLHAAKGLEWDVVYLAGCSDGYLPIAMATGPDEVEEERRLLYVGVTRARRDLVLTWAASRAAGGKAHRKPSRFLGALYQVMSGAAPATKPSSPQPAAGGKKVRVCRACGDIITDSAARKLGRCVTCPSTYDEELWEQLRQWRKEVAEHDGVPAFVVFTDATLMAVAEKLPSSVTELLTIKGVGQRKADAYGVGVLGVLEAWRSSAHGRSAEEVSTSSSGV